MRYRLLVIWYTGEKEEHTYTSYEKAKEAEKGYYTAFGNQIQFTCIDKTM